MPLPQGGLVKSKVALFEKAPPITELQARGELTGKQISRRENNVVETFIRSTVSAHFNKDGQGDSQNGDGLVTYEKVRVLGTEHVLFCLLNPMAWVDDLGTELEAIHIQAPDGQLPGMDWAKSIHKIRSYDDSIGPVSGADFVSLKESIIEIYSYDRTTRPSRRLSHWYAPSTYYAEIKFSEVLFGEYSDGVTQLVGQFYTKDRFLIQGFDVQVFPAVFPIKANVSSNDLDKWYQEARGAFEKRFLDLVNFPRARRWPRAEYLDKLRHGVQFGSIDADFERSQRVSLNKKIACLLNEAPDRKLTRESGTQSYRIVITNLRKRINSIEKSIASLGHLELEDETCTIYGQGGSEKTPFASSQDHTGGRREIENAETQLSSLEDCAFPTQNDISLPPRCSRHPQLESVRRKVPNEVHTLIAEIA